MLRFCKNEPAISSAPLAAYREGFISAAQLTVLGEELKKSGYGNYLLRVAGE